MRRTGVMLTMLLLATAPARAAQDGLVTRESRHGMDETVRRFEAAVREAGWKLFGELDHAAAAREAGLTLARRTVILFGDPASGTPAMAAHPTLALDLPMRVLVWQDDRGRVFLTRSTGADLAQRVFARHGVDVPDDAQAGMEAFQAGLVAKAAE